MCMTMKTSATMKSCSCSTSGRKTMAPVNSNSRGYIPAAGCRRQRFVVAAAGKGGLLEDATITTPTYERGTESSKKKPPIYKVMLHNDNYNRREYVVKILLKNIEGLTVDDAVNVMQEAHETGVALVIACAQEQAETYVETLRVNGLISSMEPGH